MDYDTDFARVNGQIDLVKRRVVEHAMKVLLRCTHLGQGV